MIGMMGLTSPTEDNRELTVARDSIPELVAADAAVKAHAEQMPQMPSGFFFGAERVRREWLRDVNRPWEAERDRLTQHRDAVYAEHVHKLCSKCRGTGRTQWLHRSGGDCYSCNATGWKARYRKAGAR